MDLQQILQLIFSGILAFATIGLMFFTCALWQATNKYRKATEYMAEIQEKALKVSQADVTMRAFNPSLLLQGLRNYELKGSAVETFRKLIQDIYKDIEVELQN